MQRNCSGARPKTSRRKGVDLIMMEMMRDSDLSQWACEEAIATGLASLDRHFG